MNTAKAINNTFCYIVVITIVITACRTKQLNKQLTRISDLQAQETSIESKQNELFQGNRIISMSDSGNYRYSVNIFPLDTFSFTLKDGFKGKASLIELIGTEHHVRQSFDSAAFTAKKENDVQYDHENKSREATVSKVKSMEKSKAGMVGIFMWIGIAGLIGWLGWRFWNRNSIKRTT